MVAITVILAGIIGTFILGIGDQVQDPAPTAQFDTEYDSDAGASTSDGAVTISHGGGDAIEAGAIAVAGNGLNESDGTLWYSLAQSSESEASDMVEAGDSAVVGVTTSEGASMDAVWRSDDGRSSVLAEWEQPAA